MVELRKHVIEIDYDQSVCELITNAFQLYSGLPAISTGNNGYGGSLYSSGAQGSFAVIDHNPSH